MNSFHPDSLVTLFGKSQSVCPPFATCNLGSCDVDYANQNHASLDEIRFVQLKEYHGHLSPNRYNADRTAKIHRCLEKKNSKK